MSKRTARKRITGGGAKIRSGVRSTVPRDRVGARAAQLYDDGMALATIAGILEVSERRARELVVGRAAISSGVLVVVRNGRGRLRHSGRRKQPSVGQRAAEVLYAAGWSLDGIAGVLLVGRRWVAKTLRARGVAIRPARPPSPDAARIEEAGRLYASGLTLSEVAGRLEVAKGTAANWVRASGVTMRESATDKRSNDG